MQLLFISFGPRCSDHTDACRLFFFFRKTGFMKVNEAILVRGAQELSGADKLHCEFMYRQAVH